MTAPDYQVVIVGGGMVGATLACALGGPAGLRVLVVEAAPVRAGAAPAQPSFDARSTALSHGSRESLEQLDLWRDMAGHACPIRRIHVSDRGRFGAVRMDSAAQDVEALGYVMENARMGEALNRALAGREGVEVSDLSTVRCLSPEPGGMRVAFSSPAGEREVRAPLVVLAEGGRSGLCERLGIERRQHRYQQSAIVANVSFSRDHANTAFERFTPEGPLALLPLGSFGGEHRAALVWTRGVDQAARAVALEPECFLAELHEAFGRRLGRFLRVGERFSYPLSLSRAREQYRRGLVLLGNVSQSLHPVAGQGFNLSLRNTMELARTLRADAARGAAPGSLDSLAGYARRTARDQALTVAFSDTMTRLFSSSSSPLVWVRKAGLLSIDLLPPLKHGFVERAMGRGEPRASLERPW